MPGAPSLRGRVGHIKVESLTRVAFDLGTNQLGVRHFSRFLRSGPRCCRHKARFRFSADHFSKARNGAPGVRFHAAGSVKPSASLLASEMIAIVWATRLYSRK